MDITSVSFVHGTTLLRAVASTTGKEARLHFDEWCAELRGGQVVVWRTLGGIVIAEGDETLRATSACRPDELLVIAALETIVEEDPDRVLTTMVEVR